MKTAVNILENDPMVFRYAWFSGRTTETPNVNLLAGTGQLTQLGQAYLSQPCGPSVASAIAGSDATLSTSTTSGTTTQTILVACVVLMSLVLLAAIIVVILLVLKQRVTYYN